jgi:hypothetical protein
VDAVDGEVVDFNFNPSACSLLLAVSTSVKSLWVTTLSSEPAESLFSLHDGLESAGCCAITVATMQIRVVCRSRQDFEN